MLGDANRAPLVEEVIELLDAPGAERASSTCSASPLADRPAFFDDLLPRLQELRARTGRPHWIVVDEAHHLLPAGLGSRLRAAPAERSTGLVLITVHPGARRAGGALQSVESARRDRRGTRADTRATSARRSASTRRSARSKRLTHGRGDRLVAAAPSGEPFVSAAIPPRAERRRHLRKYAEGDLGADQSFYFRGPDGQANLRAQNLQLFLQLADGVDDETWTSIPAGRRLLALVPGGRSRTRCCRPR